MGADILYALSRLATSSQIQILGEYTHESSFVTRGTLRLVARRPDTSCLQGSLLPRPRCDRRQLELAAMKLARSGNVSRNARLESNRDAVWYLTLGKALIVVIASLLHLTYVSNNACQSRASPMHVAFHSARAF